MKRLALAILVMIFGAAQAQEADEEGLSAEIGGKQGVLEGSEGVTLHFIDTTDGVDVEIEAVQFDRGPYVVEAHYKDKPDADIVVISLEWETGGGIEQASLNATVSAFDPLVYRTEEFFIDPPADAEP